MMKPSATIQAGVLAAVLGHAGLATGAAVEPTPATVTEVHDATLGHRPMAVDGRIWHLRFAADGQSLFAVADSVHRVDWRSRRITPVWSPTKDEVMGQAVFSPDGRYFARIAGNQVHLHESASGQPFHSIPGSAERIYDAVAWNADASRIAIGGHGEVLIHRRDNAALEQRIPSGSSDIRAVVWSPDGRWLAVANREGDEGDGLRLHALDGQSPPRVLPGKAHRSVRSNFCFSPDSSSIAVFAADGESGKTRYREVLYFWDIPHHRMTFKHPRGDGYNGMAYAPDGKWFAAAGSNKLMVLDARSGDEVVVNQGERIHAHIWSLAFSPDSSLLAYATDNRLKVLETATWSEPEPSPDLTAPVTAMAFSEDSQRLVTGGKNGELLLWDLDRQVPLWRRKAPPGSSLIRNLSVDPSGTWVAVVQSPMRPEKRVLSLVDMATGETRRFLSVPQAMWAAPLFPPSGPGIWLATGGQELVEWGIDDDRLLRSIPLPLPVEQAKSLERLAFDDAVPGAIRCEAKQSWASVHPDTGEQTTGINTANRRPQDCDPVPPRSTEWVLGSQCLYLLPNYHEVRIGNHRGLPLVKHPSGCLLFMANHRGVVDVLDLLSLSIIHRFSFKPGEIETLALSPDARTLMVGTTAGLHRVLLHEARQASPHTTSEVLWQVMGSENHWEAYQAAWALAKRPDFLTFLDRHLAPAQAPGPAEMAMLQTQLIDGNPLVRQTAARAWLDRGLELDRKTYETLREGGIPVNVPSKFFHPEDYPFIAAHRDVAPIPLLTPLSGYRRDMRALMLLIENPCPESLRQLERLAAGDSAVPLTAAATKAVVHARARLAGRGAARDK